MLHVAEKRAALSYAIAESGLANPGAMLEVVLKNLSG
jgi:hypothetical protein